jgi:hypothetical protein
MDITTTLKEILAHVNQCLHLHANTTQELMWKHGSILKDLEGKQCRWICSRPGHAAYFNLHYNMDSEDFQIVDSQFDHLIP